MKNANAKSHTHLQFALANAMPKIAKEYVSPSLKQCVNKVRKHNNV